MADELYLENIDEFVTDQNRVVTYKWLSYTLGVHVNQAKQMLYDYVERKRKENSGVQLHVTYLVAGNLPQNGHVCHKVAVVREDKLEAMKSKLSTIASVHVYSVQKALLKDSSPLYNTDYDIVKTNLQHCSKSHLIMTILIQLSVNRKSKSKQADKTTSDVLSKALTGVCFLFCESVFSSSGLIHFSEDVSQELLLQELDFDPCGFVPAQDIL